MHAVNIRQHATAAVSSLVTSTSTCTYVRPSQYQPSCMPYHGCRRREAACSGRLIPYPSPHLIRAARACWPRLPGRCPSLARPIAIGHVTIPSANQLLSISAWHCSPIRQAERRCNDCRPYNNCRPVYASSGHQASFDNLCS